MTRKNLYAGAARLALLFGLAALPLTGCNKSDQSSASSLSSAPSSALPLVASGEPVAPAPAASALPSAPPVPVGRLADRRQAYAFADQAYALNNAFGDAPPDYGFDYNGTQPWVWRSDNSAMRVAEPLPDGGDRYYYYEPGAEYPYLVRDPSYTYGYDDGQLVVIYDHQGRIVPESEYEARRDYASRFYARGRDLYANALQQQHQPVAQPNWVARRAQYAAEQQAWTTYQNDDTDWRAYHDSHQQQEQGQWDGERARRESEAAQFAQSINDQQTANRDMEAAQRAQARVQAASGAPGGQHFGGPSGSPSAAASPQPGFGPANQPPPNGQPSFHQGQANGAPGGGGGEAGDRHDHRPDTGFGAPGAGSERSVPSNAPAASHPTNSASPAGGGFGEAAHHDHHPDGGLAAPGAAPAHDAGPSAPQSAHPNGAGPAWSVQRHDQPGVGAGGEARHDTAPSAPQAVRSNGAGPAPAVNAEPQHHEQPAAAQGGQAHHEATPSAAPEPAHPPTGGAEHHAAPANDGAHGERRERPTDHAPQADQRPDH